MSKNLFCLIKTLQLFNSFTPVVPKLVHAVTQMKVAIMSYYPQYFAVIAHNMQQHCGFASALPPEESHITHGE